MTRLRTLVFLTVACAVALPTVVPTVAQRASGEQRRSSNRQVVRSSNRQVVVSAAVSLTEVLQQLAPMYQQASGDQVVLNVGASNTLARQIRFDAGVDLFISADEAQMDSVATHIDAST